MNRDEQSLLTEKYDGQVTPEFEADRARLASGEPVAYVIGTQPFLGLSIGLGSRPLIPRPETEWWTEAMIESVRATPPRNALDLCAGSGAIGCALLAAFPHTQVSFGELDPAHETTIRENILTNDLDTTRADIRIGDLFEPFVGMTFDLIAANPPYIPEGRALDASVTDWEPAAALFGGNDGLAIIRKIADSLSTHLTPGGTAWIECDSAHAHEAQLLFEKAGFAATLCTDQYGAPRVLVVSFP